MTMTNILWHEALVSNVTSCVMVHWSAACCTVSWLIDYHDHLDAMSWVTGHHLNFIIHSHYGVTSLL